MVLSSCCLQGSHGYVLHSVWMSHGSAKQSGRDHQAPLLAMSLNRVLIIAGFRSCQFSTLGKIVFKTILRILAMIGSWLKFWCKKLPVNFVCFQMFQSRLVTIFLCYWNVAIPFVKAASQNGQGYRKHKCCVQSVHTVPPWHLKERKEWDIFLPISSY